MDDIVTTGNTLEAIADQIKPFANHIEALCLAGTLTKLK
ncbi:phosphoribosyltransferase [Erysipelothrix sp. Poltava]|nr:phosphoribosyltransferase [Erysipelothrix sp. Poltava]